MPNEVPCWNWAKSLPRQWKQRLRTPDGFALNRWVLDGRGWFQLPSELLRLRLNILKKVNIIYNIYIYNLYTYIYSIYEWLFFRSYKITTSSPPIVSNFASCWWHILLQQNPTRRDPWNDRQDLRSVGFRFAVRVPARQRWEPHVAGVTCVFASFCPNGFWQASDTVAPVDR